MQWKRTNNSSNISGLELMLSLDGQKWYSYTHPSLSYLRKPELNIEGASAGFSTFQNCLKLGFSVVPTNTR